MSSFRVLLGSGSAVAGSCFRNRVVERFSRQVLTSFTTSAFSTPLVPRSSLLHGATFGTHHLREDLFGSSFVGVTTRGFVVVSMSYPTSASASLRSVEAESMERSCAIITGVARPNGIGRHLVYGFMAQGYNVVGVDIETPEQENDRIRVGNFHFVQADVGVFTEAERIVQETVQRYGDRIHVLINNAAKLPQVGVSDPVKEFTDTIAVNLSGAFYLSHATIPHMPAGNSSIIHMSSTRAHQSEAYTEGYSASKAGLCGLTHSQAITLAGKVRVNAVLPGWINTADEGETALRPQDHSWHPVGRVGVPQDVVEMCLFLCDEQRAGFLTGQEFVVDGGVSKKMVYAE